MSTSSRGIGRRSTLSRRRVPGFLPDGSFLPATGPSITPTTTFTMSKKKKFQDTTGGDDEKSKNTHATCIPTQLAPLTKLTPRQKNIGESANVKKIKRIAANMPQTLPQQVKVSNLHKNLQQETQHKNTSKNNAFKTEVPGLDSPSCQLDDKNFYTTNQMLTDTGNSNYKPRSLGSIFAHTMEGLKQNLKKVKEASEKAKKYNDITNSDCFVEPITSCNASRKLAAIAEEQRFRVSMCRRRSSGFGMSMSCGDGRTSFVMTGK